MVGCGDMVVQTFPGVEHFVAQLGLGLPEKVSFGLVGSGSSEEVLQADHALVRVEGIKGWNIPTCGEEGVLGEFVTCELPGLDCLFHGELVMVLVVGVPVIQGCCSQCVFTNVLLLMGSDGALF